MKAGKKWAKDRQAKFPTKERNFPNADGNKVYKYLNDMYESGSSVNFHEPYTSFGKQVRKIDTYYLIGNNCTSLSCSALQMGGVSIPTFQTPANLATHLFYQPPAGFFQNNYLKNPLH